LFLNGHIDDADLKQDEVAMLGEIAGLGPDADYIRQASYGPDERDVLKENLQYLLNSLGRGGKKVLADELEVYPTTLSRWLNGSVPHASTLRQLVLHFGLASGTDLRKDPVFLSAQPISQTERRDWLHSRIDNMRVDELRELYPALQRLLEER
jgi:hypothetical protein